jgi:cytochrome c-type biogenesis protein CcmH/NrfF
MLPDYRHHQQLQLQPPQRPLELYQWPAPTHLVVVVVAHPAVAAEAHPREVSEQTHTVPAKDIRQQRRLKTKSTNSPP